jgi:N-acetylglucosaminyldiphosphoundecaprenol N-acetyl-beta-D-mannosaminyltransferase
LLNEDLHDGLRSQSDEFYPELFAASGHLDAHVPRIDRRWHTRAMNEDLPSIEILGIPIACIDASEALTEIERLYRRPSPALIAYINAHSINLATQNAAYRDILVGSDLNLNDGSGVALAARIQGRRFKENLNGSDFNGDILRLAARLGWPVYLLGAVEGVADRAADRLRSQTEGLNIVGTHSGYWQESSAGDVAATIRASGADLVMVAMGNPRQEEWLATHLESTGARVGVGVGAFLDFTAGVVPRSPGWMNRFGVEWLWRLLQEPRRLWRRYIVGNPLFLARVVRSRLGPGNRKADG